MPETAAPSPHALKVKALELANQHPDTHSKDPASVVTRATAYHAFLAGAAAPAPKVAVAGTATTAAAPKTTTAAAAPKPGTNGAAGAPKAAQTPKPATAPKPAQAPKPAAAGAAGMPAGDTKDPKGKFTFNDVTAALRDVMNAKGREAATGILNSVGGANHTRDVKPANYDKVVAACKAALAPAPAEQAPAEADDGLGDPPEQTGGGLDADMDPTAQPERDDMGL